MICLDTTIMWQPKPTLEFFMGNRLLLEDACEQAKRKFKAKEDARFKAIQSLPILWN